MILQEVGPTGQTKLTQARVLCIGAGGLGCPALLYLAGAGVGHIGIVDNDSVDISNLQRQILYTTADIGQSKVLCAQRRLSALNPEIAVVAHHVRLTAENAAALITLYDIVIDGSDNFETRFLVNDACVMLRKPLIYGSVLRFEGQVSVFDAERGPCYRCLFPEPPSAQLAPNCAEAGVLGVLPGLIGTLQATEAIKLILGQGKLLCGRLLLYDALQLTYKELALEKNPDCPCCHPQRIPQHLHDYLLGGCAMADVQCLSATELKQRLDAGEKILIVDVREPDEYALCKIPGAQLIPLQTLPQRFSELDKAATIVLQCHHGRRSLMALEFLQQNGFTKLFNLTGGIDAWSCEVDSNIPRY